jgi:hypothetical protein
MDEPSYEIHAMDGCFFPGMGWLGLHPSHGVFTVNTHLSIASSAHFENAMPFSGGIRGSGTSKLLPRLSI